MKEAKNCQIISIISTFKSCKLAKFWFEITLFIK